MQKTKLYKKIYSCRICGNKNLKTIVDFGVMGLTGIFPKTVNSNVLKGPLEVVKCTGKNKCGLVQLRHTYNNKIMYGKTYGYRSNLNKSMVNHLEEVANQADKLASPIKNSLIIDIGSNDGTLLSFLTHTKCDLIGIDPTANIFKEYYPKKAVIISEFFSAKAINKVSHKKARIIFSIAMFYDIANPIAFAKEVFDLLENDGVWVLEQSYLPLMLKQMAYDTICHEHLTYYSLKQLKWIFDKVGFKIIDLSTNDTNGGSIKITVAKKASSYLECTRIIKKYEIAEIKAGIDKISTYHTFNKNIVFHKKNLLNVINKILKNKKTIYGYGSSTKGNVLLQYCRLSTKEITAIAEVNKDKYGHITPITNIPILAESEVMGLKPDYLIVLPWHFKNTILAKEKKYLSKGGHFIFPLPKVTVY